MTVRSLVVAGGCALSVGAVLPSTAAAAQGCPSKEYFGPKVDYYANDIKVTNVTCARADSLFKAGLKQPGWHVRKKLVQAGVASKYYRVTATKGAAKITLVWDVLTV
jgi:hypothetical protein